MHEYYRNKLNFCVINHLQRMELEFLGVNRPFDTVG